MRRIGLFCAVLVAATLLAGCTSPSPSPDLVEDEMVLAEESMQPRELVDLTIYYRQDGRLQPVLREVPVNTDLPRTALGLLLEGPPADGTPGLQAPLPRSTRVTGFTVRRGTAHVQLSREAAADAHKVGKHPRNEVLALAAVTNTLTEFPDIRRVRLRVEGQGRRLWSGWKVPDVLVRDESLVGTQRASAVRPLSGFGSRAKRMGVAQGRRRAPAVAAVRVQSQTTYLRVAVEVTSADGGPLRGPVPPTSAMRRGKTVELRVQGRPTKNVSGSLAKQIQDPAFSGGNVTVRGNPREVVVRLRAKRPAQFRLHTLSEPARVVLDVKR